MPTNRLKLLDEIRDATRAVADVARTEGQGVVIRLLRTRLPGMAWMAPAPPVAPSIPKLSLPYGFVTTGLEKAFAKACRRLAVKPLSPPLRSRLGKSCGAPVEASDGTQSWLKITGVPGGAANSLRLREAEAAAAVGISRPTILAIFNWVSQGVHWRALQTTLACSPTVATGRVFGSNLRPVSDEWITSLKTELAKLGRVETNHWHRTPEYVSAAVTERFGPGAPASVDEWRTSHGDLNWGNVTAPELTLLDWEMWGIAPRGYDYGYLLVHTGQDPSLMRRLEIAFVDELSTDSGRVGLLTACAEMLNYLETDVGDPHYWRAINDLAQRALDR